MLDAVEVAPGVLRRVAGGRAHYIGSADALVACGLVESHKLPGRPGRGRGLVTYDRDGQPVSKGPQRGSRAGRVQIIGKKGRAAVYYEMTVHLSEQRVAAIEAERTRGISWPFPQTLAAAAVEQHDWAGVPA